MIRELTTSDLSAVEEVFLNSFSQDEAPTNFAVINQLLREKTIPATLCLGYEQAGKIVGAVGFSPVYFASDSEVSAYLLAPLAVHESQQRQGIAKQLINAAKAQFKDKGIDALLVYGDPSYYERHGFKADLGKHFIPPYPLEYEFGWQAMLLNDLDVSNLKLRFTCVSALSDAVLW